MTELASRTGAGTNWSGNVTFSADHVEQPHTVGELRDLVTGSRRIRAIGSRHSFNTVADSPDTLVSLSELSTESVVDAAASRVTVPAGVRFGDVYRMLDSAGLALHNTGSLPHISVVGACATATHGSGIGNGNLATAVSGLELVTADGELRTLDARTAPETFAGSVVALGSLGLVTRATLEVQPRFDMRQDIYDDLPFDAFFANAEAVFDAGYSVSLFTCWQRRLFHQVWVKTRLTGDDPGSVPGHLFGARPADGPRHMIPGIDPVACTQQLGVPGPWYERLPHFRLEFTPSAGAEIQTEYFLPREDAADAIRALEPLSERIAELLLVTEIRTIAADELWLSPAYQRDSVAVHFTWKRDQAAIEALLPEIEARLEPFEPRPHWGKVFTMAPELVASRYPRLKDFRALAESVDPTGRFRNPFTDTFIFG
jgi:xylitol oxidase